MEESRGQGYHRGIEPEPLDHTTPEAHPTAGLPVIAVYHLGQVLLCVMQTWNNNDLNRMNAKFFFMEKCRKADQGWCGNHHSLKSSVAQDSSRSSLHYL